MDWWPETQHNNPLSSTYKYSSSVDRSFNTVASSSYLTTIVEPMDIENTDRFLCYITDLEIIVGSSVVDIQDKTSCIPT